MAGADGRLDRVKVMDPSFLNWRPLSYALLKNIVPDFPLCNKVLQPVLLGERSVTTRWSRPAGTFSLTGIAS
jgi:Ni,Fe-hydrogenase III large subunit